MNAKHTIGPWNHKPVNGKCAGLVFGTQPGRTYGRVIARVADCGGGVGEAVANRMLIAAAPDLLEACKSALAWMELAGNGQAQISDDVRKAIARAESEAQP